MKKAKNIRNLDTLEREIYCLKLEAKTIEQKLDRNFEHLQENCSSLCINSIFQGRKNKEDGKSSFFDSFFKNENLNAVISKITDRITDRAAEGIDNLLDKIFHKRK